MDLSEYEKQIYNSFLASSRIAKNKPFKLRQNFDKFDDKDYIAIKKLSDFFNNNKTVSFSNFFIAPYKVYDDQYFDLQFFTTRRALKCYTMYMHKKETQSPDNEDIVTTCKECLIYIYNFCKERGLSLDEYKYLMEGVIPMPLFHLKEHKINFYVVHALECESAIKTIEPSLVSFIIPDYFNLSNTTRINFLKSTRLKNVLRESISIIEKQLLKTKNSKIN